MSFIGRWPLSLKTDSVVAGCLEGVKSVPIAVYLSHRAWSVTMEAGSCTGLIWLYLGCAWLTLLTALCVLAASTTDNHRFLLPYMVSKVGVVPV